MTYSRIWHHACVCAKLALAGALVTGITALAAPAQAVTINGFGVTIDDTQSLSVGDVYAAEVRGDATDGAGSFFLGFEATNNLVAVETNTINPLAGFEDPFIEWNTAPDGNGTTLAFLDSAQLMSGGLTTMVLGFLAGETRYLIVSWSNIAQDQANWDIRIEAVPLPAGLLLFLSGLAGIGFLGRYKVRRQQPTAT